MHTLTIARDTYTELGILPKGMTVQAQPNADYSAWVVEMSLPRAAGISHPLPLPSSAVWGGGRQRLDSLDRARCAHHDYNFAREFLGLGHLSAIRWLLSGYQVDERTLMRWGFRNIGSDEAAA
ncbi:hypothetical protein ACFWPK_33180 [Nocardia sp. NPDC058519]|uniref:hypothetical protein n=1 Tax=Nocardia sp. NPDC058519 TaxID=3346535 RepID=UPI00366A2D5A